MITWPPETVIPPPKVDFAGEVDAPTIRTKMDSGRVRQRQRFTREFRPLRVAWKLKDEEFGLFQSIHKHALNSGADWFTITLPLGDGMKEYTVRFSGGGYSFKYDEVMYWDVSAKLETEDQAEPQDAETVEALAAIEFDIAAFELAVEGLTEVTDL
jgi:hypothetical protein